MPDPQVSELLRRGIAAAQAGRKEEARQLLLRVTELDERNERAWLWLSGVVEPLEDRRAYLERVLAINPANAHAQAGLRWLDQQTLPAAQEYCPSCRSPVPPSGTKCPHCAQILIVACPGCGEYIDVENVVCLECGQFLGDFVDGAQYHLGLAQAYLEHQRYTRAEEAAARAEAEAPDDPAVIEENAALYEAIGNTDLAIFTYKRVIDRDPARAVPYARLGAIYRRRAMLQDARAMYEMAVERAGNDAAVLFDLAQLYLEEEATSQVVDLLERVVRLEPGHTKAHALLGDAYLERRQGAQAIQHYERAYELATPESTLRQEVRRKLAGLRPSTPESQAQGWGETLRRVAGLMISPSLAALANARLVPWEISLAAWASLMVGTVGAYMWVCATDVPRNPVMRAFLGEAGVEGFWWKMFVGLPGVLLWGAAFGTILWKV